VVQSLLIEIFLNAILGTSFAVAKQSIRQSSICYCELLGYDNAPMSNVNSLLQRHNMTSLRWPTRATSIINQISNSNSLLQIQIQIHHSRFKFITPNSNSSLQIQIHHFKFKFITPNSNSSLQIQIHHSKFKFITPNSNSSLQIQIHHFKFKFITPNSNSSLVSGNNLK
jgi:hypothetical protein